MDQLPFSRFGSRSPTILQEKTLTQGAILTHTPAKHKWIESDSQYGVQCGEADAQGGFAFSLLLSKGIGAVQARRNGSYQQT